MSEIEEEVKQQPTLLQQRLKYFLEKKNQVFLCIIDYTKTPFVSFGASNLREPYEMERELRRGIYWRKLKNGITTYVTHVKGQYCILGHHLLMKGERIIVAYSPKWWSLRSRDEELEELFIRASISIKAFKEIVEEEYEKGNATLEQKNEYIRNTNVAQLEIKKLMDRYCYTNI